jgi:hypothetical protein
VHAPLHWEDDGQALLFTAEQQAASTCGASTCPTGAPRCWCAGGWVQAFDKAAGTLVTLADSADHPGPAARPPAGRRAAPHRAFNDSADGRLATGRHEEVWSPAPRATRCRCG